MNSSKFQEIRQDIGMELVNFALNRIDLKNDSDFSNIQFSTIELTILNYIYSEIRRFRILHLVQGGYGDMATKYIVRPEQFISP